MDILLFSVATFVVTFFLARLYSDRYSPNARMGRQVKKKYWKGDPLNPDFDVHAFRNDVRTILRYEALIHDCKGSLRAAMCRVDPYQFIDEIVEIAEKYNKGKTTESQALSTMRLIFESDQSNIRWLHELAGILRIRVNGKSGLTKSLISETVRFQTALMRQFLKEAGLTNDAIDGEDVLDSATALLANDEELKQFFEVKAKVLGNMYREFVRKQFKSEQEYIGWRPEDAEQHIR